MSALTLAQTTNLAARFLLELCALAALGYWGFRANAGLWKLGLGVGAPLLAAAVWSVFVSPQAAVHVPWPVHLALQAAIFVAAAAGLAAAGQSRLGGALLVVAALNWVLMTVWGQ